MIYGKVWSFTSPNPHSPRFVSCKDVGANTILQDIARARENIQKSLAGVSSSECVELCCWWTTELHGTEEDDVSGFSSRYVTVCFARDLFPIMTLLEEKLDVLCRHKCDFRVFPSSQLCWVSLLGSTWSLDLAGLLVCWTAKFICSSCSISPL